MFKSSFFCQTNAREGVAKMSAGRFIRPKTTPICCVNGCNSESRPPANKYYSFPECVLLPWMEACRSDRPIAFGKDKICCRHFSDADFKNPKTQVLKRTAVPTLHLLEFESSEDDFGDYENDNSFDYLDSDSEIGILKKNSTDVEHNYDGEFFHRHKNPLKDLINYKMHIMPKGRLDNYVIVRLGNNILRRVLNMFGCKYSQVLMMKEGNKDIKDSVANLLNFKIDLECLIVLLKRWNGWVKYNTSEILGQNAYRNLFRFLMSNLDSAKGEKRFCINEEMEHMRSLDNLVNYTGSLQNLQTLFYHEPRRFGSAFRTEFNIVAMSHHLTPPEYICNWPFITTQIELPGFNMTHKMLHHNEFEVMNYDRFYPEVYRKPVNTDLHFKADNSTESQWIMSKVVLTFLNLLIKTIDTIDKIPLKVKSELSQVVSELSADVALCTGEILIRTEYFCNLFRHPYVRYLGYPTNGDIPMLIEDQKKIKNTDINLRLKQTCWPRVSFSLNQFQLQCIKFKGQDSYVFNTEFLNSIESCVKYVCTLCNQLVGNASDSDCVFEHFLNCRGFEPHWECSSCMKTLHPNLLSKQRWIHTCDKT